MHELLLTVDVHTKLHKKPNSAKNSNIQCSDTGGITRNFLEIQASRLRFIYSLLLLTVCSKVNLGSLFFGFFSGGVAFGVRMGGLISGGYP